MLQPPLFMTLKDALQLLELSTPFTRSELKKAYGQALKVWHPDRFQAGDDLHAKAHEKTRLIIEAFGYLSRALGSDDSYPPPQSESPRPSESSAPNSKNASSAQAPQKPEPRRSEPQSQSKTRQPQGTPPPVRAAQTDYTPTPSQERGSSFVETFIRGFIAWALVVMTWAAIFNSDTILQTAFIGGLIGGGIRGILSYNAPAINGVTATGCPVSGLAMILWIAAIPVWIYKWSSHNTTQRNEPISTWAATPTYDNNATSRSQDQQLPQKGVDSFPSPTPITQMPSPPFVQPPLAPQVPALSTPPASAIVNQERNIYSPPAPQDPDAKRIKQLRARAEKGDVIAQYDLGLYYASGNTAAKNENEAQNWLTRAANQGDANAQYQLAKLYERTSYPDYIQAYKWFSLSLAHDGTPLFSDKFKISFSVLEAKMTREEIARAKKLAREFRPIKNDAR